MRDSRARGGYPFASMAGNPLRAPRGTRDLLPEDLILVHHMERTAVRLARCFGYQEIRTPLFEETTLFSRTLGDTSDVVSKEMFTVPRRGESKKPSFTFRPEGTASVARAYVSGGLAGKAPLQKWFYLGPMFRYERPQKGRERQFNQFGVEAFGSSSPILDAEVIHLAASYFEALGMTDGIEIRINSMGDPADRAAWGEQLRQFFQPAITARCDDCQHRLAKNVFRLLDCKVEACQKANHGAPPLADVMTEDSSLHHGRVRKALLALGRQPIEDLAMVRGLDYYTRTVFEIHYPKLGARSALCGGGRYDGLVEAMGGPATPAIGFAIGMTPTELALAELGLPKVEDMQDLYDDAKPFVYVIAVSEEDRQAALVLADCLRGSGIGRIELDYRSRSTKGQFKEAGKLGSRFACVIGPDERAQGKVVLRNMTTREEQTLDQAEALTKLRNFASE